MPLLADEDVDDSYVRMTSPEGVPSETSNMV